MKTLKYNFFGNIKEIPYSEANEEIAKSEAYNGEYEIIDDGAEEVSTPSQEERIAALESALLEMIGVTVND